MRERLAPVDAAWFRMDADRNQADIAALMLLGGELDEGKLRDVLERRLLVHERFRSRVVDSKGRLAPPHWEPERSFSLDAHLERCSVRGDLETLLGDLMSIPLDMNVSPWKITLLDGLPDGTGLFVRVHHCMGDGFALLDLLVSLARDESPARVEPPGEKRARGWGTARELLSSTAHLLLLPFDSTNGLRGPISGQRRVAWSERFAVDDLKAIARAHGATINDIVMTALSGAFRRALLERGRKAPNLRAIVPVNLRPKGEPLDLSRGNWFGLVFVDLGTNVELPAVRLAELRMGMNRIKQTREAVVALGILGALGRVPAAVDLLVERIFARKASVVVTNVPGPRDRLRLAGLPIDDLVFWVPHPCGLACGASVISYAGSVRVGVRVDATLGIDPERIARLFTLELEALDARPAPSTQTVLPHTADAHA